MNFDRRILAAVFLLLLLAFAGGVKYQGLNESTGREEEIPAEDIISDLTSADVDAENETESLIQVYVCGKVQTPGIYMVKEGARLHEVIELAGALEDAELRYLGMARELLDGETIVVPAVGDIDAADSSVSTMATFSVSINNGRVNINQATADEMASKLTGIGPVLSQRIVDYRLANGPFEKAEDLQKVAGIGDKKFADIKESICVR